MHSSSTKFRAGMLQGLLVTLGAMLVIAAVAPSSPPVRLVAGTGLTIVTNALNYFTLSATNSGGSTNTLIAGTGAFIITNSATSWTIGSTNRLAAGSGITITTNAANSWTVAATGGTGPRLLFVNVDTVTGTNDQTGALHSCTILSNYVSNAGDAISFVYAGEFVWDGNPKSATVMWGTNELANFQFGDAQAYSFFTFRGTITASNNVAQVAEVTGIEQGVEIPGAVTAYNTNITQSVASGVTLSLVTYGEVIKRVARVTYEPAP